jgi:hypothetical protein
VPLQVHAPLWQLCPDAHAPQIAPAVPHWALLSPATSTQVPFALAVQQPPEHDVALQTQTPLVVALQSWPDAHAAHWAPPVPHEALPCAAYASHVPLTVPLQQPFGHELASHSHWPLTQASPEGHAAEPLDPQTQVPLELHVSVVLGSHVPQALPGEPHAEVVSLACAVQVPVLPPAQHPLGHVLLSHEHVPLLVSQRPFEQVPQAEPLAPH